MLSKPIWILVMIAIVVGSIFWAAGGSEIKEEIPYYLKKVIRETARVSIRERTIDVEVARTSGALAKGLSGRETLASGRGMIFVFEKEALYPFTMKDMRFSIDIVWINNDRIVYIAHSALPGIENIDPGVNATHVLEVQNGVAQSSGWQVGDPVTITFDKD